MEGAGDPSGSAILAPGGSRPLCLRGSGGRRCGTALPYAGRGGGGDPLLPLFELGGPSDRGLDRRFDGIFMDPYSLPGAVVSKSAKKIFSKCKKKLPLSLEMV